MYFPIFYKLCAISTYSYLHFTYFQYNLQLFIIFTDEIDPLSSLVILYMYISIHIRNIYLYDTIAVVYYFA